MFTYNLGIEIQESFAMSCIFLGLERTCCQLECLPKQGSQSYILGNEQKFGRMTQNNSLQLPTSKKDCTNWKLTPKMKWPTLHSVWQQRQISGIDDLDT